MTRGRKILVTKVTEAFPTFELAVAVTVAVPSVEPEVRVVRASPLLVVPVSGEIVPKDVVKTTVTGSTRFSYWPTTVAVIVEV